jgi:hypothetical protein
MALLPDRFHIGDVPSFLALVKIIKTDPEFCLCFDFGSRCVEIESMLMAGVVAVGIRLVQDTSGILAPSPITRLDRITLRVDSGAFHQAVVGLNHVPYAYMSFGLTEEDAAIGLYTYNKQHVRLGSAIVSTLNLEEHDADFLVTNEEQREPLSYDVQVEQLGATWKAYMQSSAIDTVIRYIHEAQTIQWETKNQQTTVSLYLPVSVKNAPDVRVCILPSVLSILRSVLQVTSKQQTTLSIGEDLPVRLFAPLDTVGSFIRAYAGTKDDN